MYSIGEFSKITGLPVRRLRFYHEKGLLIPAQVDAHSGYRLYDERNIETARAITALRQVEFSLDEIRQLLARCAEDADMLVALERQKHELAQQATHLGNVVAQIDYWLQQERLAKQAEAMATQTYQIEDKRVPPLLVAGIRMKGRYDACGQAFARLGKQVGRYASGKPLCLFYDGEYREEDADFEPCFPLRKQVKPDGLDVRELAGGRVLSLMHRGPYEQLSRSYARIIRHAKAAKLATRLPSREIYHRGPGMIFRGNPNKYLTEIQLFVDEAISEPSEDK